MYSTCMISVSRRKQNSAMGGGCQGLWLLALCTVAALLVGPAHGQLSPNFYASSCPSLASTVRSGLASALRSDVRIGASLLRMFFHDCFVQGCDASVLLDDTSGFQGEKNAGPNAGSLRGFPIIDSLKSTLERNCPRTVSCADILAIVARDAVVANGGPSWNVELGRRDGTTASISGANNLPGPGLSASQLISAFAAKGLNTVDLVALSGAHTYGKSQCVQFNSRLGNFANTGGPDPSLDTNYLNQLRAACPVGTNRLVDLDQGTPGQFDSQYYTNLRINRGLLTSDQTLANSGQTARIVNAFTNQNAFFSQFAASMIKLGRLGVLTGSQGQIRNQCRFVNSS